MKVVALISGGKDSCYNMMQCIAAGHEIVALANLIPHNYTEIDSYMYQSVGHEAIELIAKAMQLPLFQSKTRGKAYQQDKDYHPTDDDEVEDLFKLLHSIKSSLEFEAVSVGAILSDYQRVRVENVCGRLGVTSLAYLWRRDQKQLLKEMLECEVDAVIIKVATLGLEPAKHLGQHIRNAQPHLLAMHEKFGLNVCGEGGEYETLTLDCPLYANRIVIVESETIQHSDDAIAPVGFLKLNKLKLETKLPYSDLKRQLMPLKDSDGYVTDHGEEAAEFNPEEISDDISEVAKIQNPQNNTTIVQSCTSAKSSNGWLWIGGITGQSADLNEAMKQVMDKLTLCLSVSNQKLEDICAVTMYIQDMSNFVILNKLYSETLSHNNPPSRACVQVPLSENCPLILEAISWSPPQTATGDVETERCTMHVQSVSHWAPANIGPYSQAVRVGDLIHISGQIGLVPGSMKLVDGGIKSQCQLALRHINRILKAVDNNINLRDVVQGVCYVTNLPYIEIARKLWESRTNNAIVDYVVVSNLPRNAAVEWHVWAHRHNSQFEYEETGKFIEDWSVALFRRWNYENNMAAIVCHIDHPQEINAFLNKEIFKEALEYALDKLQQNNGGTIRSTSSVKIFCSVQKDLPIQDFIEILNDAQKSVCLVYTVVPVVALKNEHTYLSLCGVQSQ